jgi:hypothetical protein
LLWGRTGEAFQYGRWSPPSITKLSSALHFPFIMPIQDIGERKPLAKRTTLKKDARKRSHNFAFA